MKREDYFSFLQETSESIKPTIKNYIEPFRDINKELYEILMFFVRSRLNTRLQKPTLFRLAYELCGGKDWEKVIPAAVAFEFINISSYQANSAFDEKLGVLTKQQKDSQFLASMISRELSFEIASAIEKSFGEQLATKLYSSLSISNYNVYLAQHYDLNVLTVENLEDYRNEDLFLKDYTQRCFCGSGVINGQCAYIGGLLAGGELRELQALQEFGESFGTALQIVNDVGDFVPNNADPLISRGFQDQYSDLKNGRLTLPLYHLLRLGSHKVKTRTREIIEQGCPNEYSLFEITKLLLENGAIMYAKEKAKILVKKAERHLSSFEEIQSKNLLLIMATIILTNKYFVALRRVTDELTPLGVPGWDSI